LGQKAACDLIKSPLLFDQAYNEWVGVMADKLDLIDPNLSFIDSIKVNKFNFDNIIDMMFKLDQFLEDSYNFSAESQKIRQKLNIELNEIIPNVLPNSIFYFYFIISNSPLHVLFFDQFEKIYNSFEIILNTFMQSDQIIELSTFENTWKNFIQNTNDIYISIADTFWKNQNNYYPNELRKVKIRAAKARMFSEAQNLIKMENPLKPTTEQTKNYRKIYQSIIGIPGLQEISGKIFYIYFNLNFKQ
jgi:hypothetical protein